MKYQSDSETIKVFLDKVAENIRQESERQGRVATGRTVASLRSLVTTATGAQLIADANILRTEFGTSPEEAREQSFTSLVDSLNTWMAAKGLQLNPYALAHTLRKYGSKLYQSGQTSGVLSNFINENDLQEFTETLANKYLRETNSQLFV